MPLKIIGPGFGRTGTLSLCTALDRLGFPCYHMSEIFKRAPHPPFSPYSKENESHLLFWHNVANGKFGAQYDWERVFSNYAAAVDYPAASVWRELLSAYPDAKVILTVHPRGAAAWYESIRDTIYYFSERMWQFKVITLGTPSGWKIRNIFQEMIWRRSLEGTIDDRRKAIERYQEHIAEVRASVPPERLLVYSVDQGWPPLCRFLGVPEPSEEFPNVNARAVFRTETIGEFIRGAYVVLGVYAFAALALGGLVYAITRVLF